MTSALWLITFMMSWGALIEMSQQILESLNVVESTAVDIQDTDSSKRIETPPDDGDSVHVPNRFDLLEQPTANHKHGESGQNILTKEHCLSKIQGDEFILNYKA